MPMTTAGLNRTVALLIGEAVTAFNNANAHIGVGDSDAAFSAAHTDLQASSNKERAEMRDGFPTRTDNVLTFEARFGPDDANFAWEEQGVFDAAESGVMLARNVEDLGVKSGGTWDIEYELSVSLA